MELNTDRIELKIGDTTIVFKVEKIITEETERPERPYDHEGRLDGRKAISDFTSLSESTISKMMASGLLKYYNLGSRKIVAYKDDVREAVLNMKQGKISRKALCSMS